MLAQRPSLERFSPLWKPVFSYPCSVDGSSTHDSCCSPYELATACLVPDEEWSKSFKQLSKDQHGAQSVCVVVEASYPVQGDSCSIKASFSTAYMVPCAPATPPQSTICLRPLTPVSSWKSLPVVSDEDSGLPAYSTRSSSPGALSSANSDMLIAQTTHHHPPTTPTKDAAVQPCSIEPSTLDFLNMDSRVALCVPAALLKEIIKVPLAAPDDKFLYSVNPVSKDVLPVFSLGAGAFGQVKLVYVETPAPRQELRMCAVKCVPPGPSYQEQDFWHEVELMRQCRECPQVLHLFSAAADQDGFHMLMEVAGNGSLRDLLWACSLYDEAGEVLQGFSEPVARYLVAGLLLALQHLHSLSIAHLDIKPENVLLDSSFRAKLADFGVARQLDRRSSTKPTDLVGTSGYQPPEMLSGKGYGIAADMWAVGITAYQLVAGDLPADWQLDLLLDKGIFRPPAGLSQDLEHLLSGLLSTDPTSRLSAAQAMCHPWFDGFDWAAFRDGSMPLPQFTIYHRLPNQRTTSASACQRAVCVDVLE